MATAQLLIQHKAICPEEENNTEVAEDDLCFNPVAHVHDMQPSHRIHINHHIPDSKGTR